MIVLLYRWRIKAGRMAAFQSAWTEVTEALARQGSHGSTLFDGSDGTVVAIARWPDRATRERSSLAGVAPEAIARMADAIAEKIEESVLDPVVERWADYP